MASTRKPILIAGGGLASLLLAQSLRRSGIPFVVFERDQSMSFRGQGYRLRLSSAGLDAIEAVLGDDFPRFYDRCGKTGGARGFASVNAVTGEEVATPGAKPGARPQLATRDGLTIGISRGDMRALFAEGCEGAIRWGHAVAGYELTADGVRAVFADGTKSEEGDMLVGGEGVHSRVAAQVSGGALKTYDTGARGIHGQAPTGAFRGLGEGVWRIVDDSNPVGQVNVMTNVRRGDMDDPDAIFGWTMGGHPGVIRPPNDDFAIVGQVAADLAKALTRGWHDRVRLLFDQMDEANAAFWKITCSSPWGIPAWDTHPRVTLIGDAVHSMTPAAGNGANTALRDSELLGRLLGAAGGYSDTVSAEYEKGMRAYAADAVRESYELAKLQWGINIDPETTPTVG